MAIYPLLTDNYVLPTVYDRVSIHGFEVTMNFDDKPQTQFDILVRPTQHLDMYKKRGEDIGTLLKRTYADTHKIILTTLKSDASNFNSDLKLDLKNLLENYKSLLDYTAHYIADNCSPVPSPKKVYFPIANLGVSREDFIKSLNRSFPKLQSLNHSLFEYLLQIQYFNNDHCLAELNQLANSFKHQGLAEFTPHLYESQLLRCGDAGFRVGELGFDSVSLDYTGRLILKDRLSTAIISGPHFITFSNVSSLLNIENLTIDSEQRILLKAPFSQKSLTGLIWAFSRNVIRIIHEICKRHKI